MAEEPKIMQGGHVREPQDAAKQAALIEEDARLAGIVSSAIERHELDLAEVDAVYAKLQELGELIESMHYSVRHRTVDEALERIFPGSEPVPPFWRNFIVGAVVTAHSHNLSIDSALAIGKTMARQFGIEMLEETIRELPPGHHEKPGLIRAVEILKYAPKEN